MAEDKKQKNQTATETTVKSAAIHPAYDTVNVTCACGKKYQVGSTAGEDINLALCSNCHPFYTGEQKIVDTENLVAKFEKKAKQADKKTLSRTEKRAAKRKARSKIGGSTDDNKDQKELTLKDIMKALQDK